MFLAEEDTTADAFCLCVSLGGRRGGNVTAMKVKNASAFLCAILFFG